MLTGNLVLHRRRNRWFVVAMLALWSVLGCDVDRAESIKTRYRSERLLERAELRAAQLSIEGKVDQAGWIEVAGMYGQATEQLGIARIETHPTKKLSYQLAKLTTRALLRRAQANSYAGDRLSARIDYETILNRATTYPGAQADAALGLARSEDRNLDWNAAYTAYKHWLQGVRQGTWPLRMQAMSIPAYVSRRLGARSQIKERKRWVEEASIAFEAAALREEHAKRARYRRFLLLLDASHWQAAYSALRQTQEIHDPQGRDDDLTLAEANLLAHGLERPQEALGLLMNLQDAGQHHDVQNRVAAALMAGQIHSDAKRFDKALPFYRQALDQARSSMGRAEATLGLARSEAALGHLELARRHYGRLREIYPSTPAGLLSPLEEYGFLRTNGLDSEAAALLSESMMHYRRTILYFGTELPALRATAYLSEVMGLAGSWENGVAFLDSIANRFQKDPRAGSLLLRAARLSIDRLDDPSYAYELLQRVRQRYPNSDLAVAVAATADSLRGVIQAP